MDVKVLQLLDLYMGNTVPETGKIPDKYNVNFVMY